MTKKVRKHIYINNLNTNGAVFQTQILDWLNLYKNYGVEFSLIQAFHIKEFKNPGNLKRQIIYVKKCTELLESVIFMLPSKGIYYLINASIIYLKLFKYLYKYKEVVIFSRALIGKEISFLKKILPSKIIFYYDGRAASAEENKYMAQKEKDFSLKKYKTIANIHYLEYKTLCSAEKIFTVSGILRKYFQQTYNTYEKQFVHYPCLSDANKFFFSPELRAKVRNELKIEGRTRVFIYSGGISSVWHITTKMFSFFNRSLKYDDNSIMLCLTKDIMEVNKIIAEYPEMKNRVISFHVPNDEVHRYLNAADFGILFRDNTLMNNVASPTKFAEYMLCGLPVVISEGVGDYSEFTLKNDVGILIKEIQLENYEKFDFKNFMSKDFERSYIAEIGIRHFSKESIINYLIEELNN